MKKLLTLISIIFFFSCNFPTQSTTVQEEQFVCVDEYVVIDSVSYYQCDLDVLQIFIDNSDSLNMAMDVDSSGVIEVLELGRQVWVDGRIITLDCNWWVNNSQSFNNCGVTGEIPPEIGNLMDLEYLALGDNHFIGEIPPEIGNLMDLEYLALGDNHFTGEIPLEIGNLTNLSSLALFDNQFTGEIPSSIWNLTNLRRLYLNDNQITGEIPPEIGNLTNLESLALFDNQLTGEIPSSIWNLTNLRYLYLNDNQITGEIPPEIGNLLNLHVLALDNNQLIGEIPSEICNLTLYFSGWTFNISNNQLCPPYPECLFEYDIDEQDTTSCGD